MPRLMLHTDTCCYVMKRSHPLVLKRLQSMSVDEVCMSVVTKAELLYGVEVSPRRTEDAAALAAFLPYLEVVALDEDSALAGVFPRRLRRRASHHSLSRRSIDTAYRQGWSADPRFLAQPFF